MKKNLVVLTVVICLLFPAAVFAGGALDSVQSYVDRVLEVLHDPSLKADSDRKVKKEKVRAIADEMFDFTELSKRTLAKNWSKFNSDQQMEFIRLYKSLLADTYADKLFAYNNEKIVFSKEVPITDKTVEVRSTVIGKTAEFSMNYKMILKADGWKVYDIVVEGVSLINNYRSQFREILINKQPEAVLEILRKKVGKAT